MISHIYIFILEAFIFFYSLLFWNKFINETGFILDNLEQIKMMMYNIILFIFHLSILSISIYILIMIVYGIETELINYIQIVCFLVALDFIFGGGIKRDSVN
uniref:Uncharacterized protein n=1 Tax=viral metagenome TaxID=1070528 RepID=A0A6C0F404_9ZZZZ|tara:strand:- start:6364 stop:6669 length:306 start_codon:yes stop_codon:yes gene_type:complete